MEAITWYAKSFARSTDACSPVLLVAGDKVPVDWRFEERIKLLRSARRLNLKGHHHLHIGTTVPSALLARLDADSRCR